MLAKRTLDDALQPTKRTRLVDYGRLCDLREGLTTFACPLNAMRAKERGFLRNREASSKYEECERKLFLLLKESGDVDFPEEDWVFTVLPELAAFERETLDTLLAQADQHAKYERAARELVKTERERWEAAHDKEMRAVRVELESESTRASVSAEMSLKQLEDQSQEELNALRAEAEEKIGALEERVEELEGELESAQKKLLETEAEAEEECERLREQGMEVLRKLQHAQDETDLKRETSRKLKEEIIDNDRLTVANLNRIKHLEQLVEQHKRALEESEGENEELRGELAKTLQSDEASAEALEEVSTLRELLSEREAQIASMSQKLAEAHGSHVLSPSMARRESLLDRFGISAKSYSSSAA